VWNECHQKYRLYYVDKFGRDPSGFFLGGIAIHKTIEEAYRQGWFTPTDSVFFDPFQSGNPGWEFYLKTITELVEAKGGPDAIRWSGKPSGKWPNGEDFDWWRSEEPRSMLVRASWVAQQDLTDGRILYEKDAPLEGLEMTLMPIMESTGREVKVVLDSFLMLDAGEPLIRDWTTGWDKSPMQAATYAWAVGKALGIKVDRAQYIFLREPKAADGIQDLDVSGLVPLVEQLYLAFEAEREEALGSDRFPINPGKHCNWCPVRAGCDYGLALESATS
jgi:hypothetical protein